MIFDCDWELRVMSWTIVIGLLLLFITAILARKFILTLKDKEYWTTALYGFLVVFILFIVFTSLIGSPQNIYLTDDSLKINRLFDSVEIEYSSIKEIRKVTNDDLIGETRNNGSSGFGGDLGIWSSQKLGKYEKYTTNAKKQIWMEVEDGNNIMFSCKTPEHLIEIVKEKLVK